METTITTEKDFFQEATIRICGSLDLEKSLFNCAQYLLNHIPMDVMFIDLINEEEGTVQNIAVVDRNDILELETISRLPAAIHSQLLNAVKTGRKVTIMNRLELNPYDKDVLNIPPGEEASYMDMGLELEGNRLAWVCFKASGQDRFNESHIKLFSLLHDPFAMAVSNALRYQEIFDLKNRLADDNRYLNR